MKKSILILSIALTFPATVMLAQGPRGKGGPGGPPPPPGGPGHGDGPGEVHDDPHRNPMFHALLRAIDTDGDGIISMSEMNHAAEVLLALDKNNDGMLSHDELVPHHDHKDGPPPPPRGPKPDKPDNTDKPDKGDKPDPDKADAADKGDDKKPDGDKGRKPRKPKDGDPDAKDGNPPPPPPPREDEQRSALVEAIDTDHDGIISADEIAAARANLKKLDLNHDGKLEPREYSHPHPKNN